MTASHWRKESARVIQGVIRDNPGAPLKELRALISAAYPFGQRAYHPYKIWCSEVRAQLAPKAHKKKPSLDASKLPSWLSVKGGP